VLVDAQGVLATHNFVEVFLSTEIEKTEDDVQVQ